MGGGIRLRIRCRLPWWLQHHFPSSKTYHFESATAPDLVAALDVATVLALPALQMRCFPHPLYQHWGEGYRCVPSTPNRRSVDVIGCVAAIYFRGHSYVAFWYPKLRHVLVPIRLTFWSLHRRHGLRLYLSIPRIKSLACPKEGHCVGAVVKRSLGYVGKNVWCTTRF